MVVNYICWFLYECKSFINFKLFKFSIQCVQFCLQNYYLFLLFRSFVGVGEASYSTIAPTIISDMFVKDLRSKMLALFYFAIPVGRY